LFSAAHRTFSKIDDILGHKARLNTFKKIRTIPCIISNHNECNSIQQTKETTEKFLNSTLLQCQLLTEEIREEIKIS
jgi:hypothetical protein